MAGTTPVGKSDGGRNNFVDSQLDLPLIDGHCHLFGQSLSSTEQFHPLSIEGRIVFVCAGNPAQKHVIDAPAKVRFWYVPPSMSFGTGMPTSPKPLPDDKTVLGRAVIEVPPTHWPLSSPSLPDIGLLGRFLAPGLTRATGFVPSLADSVGRQDLSDKSWGKGAKMGAHAMGNDGTNAAKCLDAVPKEGGRAVVSLLLDLGYTPLNVPHAVLNHVFKALDITPRVMADPDGFYTPGVMGLWPDRNGLQFSIEALANVAADFPGEVFPLVPYDPRRAIDPKMTGAKSALKLVENAIDKLGYAGVKLYSRCGWMPAKNEVIHGPSVGPKLDKAMDDLYAYLEKNDIPVLNHTSPTGFPPNDILLFPRRYEEGLVSLVTKAGSFPIPQKPAMIMSTARTPAQAASDFAFDVAWRACTAAANYNHYVQATVSPYSWLPVLEKHKKLRLCFAHSGSQLSVISHVRENGSDPKLFEYLDMAYKEKNGALKGVLKELHENPCVGSGAWFAKEGFPECCRMTAQHLVDKLLDGEPSYTFSGVKTYDLWGWTSGTYSWGTAEVRTGALYSMVRFEVDKLLAAAPWKQWIEAWKAEYPVDWYTKILELISDNKSTKAKKFDGLTYPNLYADIAYYSGEKQASFQRILSPLIVEAQTKELAWGKTIFGTDWWMTEMDGIPPETFWNWVMDVVDTKHPMWRDWATINTLNYLNLKDRIPKMEAWYKYNNSAVVLPSWWKSLLPYYKQRPA